MGTETDKLMTLAKGVRAISPGLKIEITNSESNPDQFCISVAASSVIIIFTGFGTMESVLSLAISKLANISQRTLAAVKPADE
jgi:hypothetical protein